MAISVIGVNGSMGVVEWSILSERMMDAKQSCEVVSGLGVSAASGTRALSVAAGESVQAGTRALSDAAVTKTLAANTSGQTRIDLVCMQVDWFNGTTANTSGTAGDIVVLQGKPAANPIAPAVTQDAGNLWQTPLAQVQVANGASTFTSVYLTDVRPISSGGYTSATLAPPGAWNVPAASAWTVERVGGTAFMGGRFSLTSGGPLAAGYQTTFGDAALVPPGFRPAKNRDTAVFSNTTGVVKGLLIVLTDGTCQFTVGSSVATGDILRVADVSWPVA